MSAPAAEPYDQVATELAAFADLVGDLPVSCDIRWNAGPSCPERARWIGRFTRPCNHSRDPLICDTHAAEWRETLNNTSQFRLTAVCKTCGVARSLITLERL